MWYKNRFFKYAIATVLVLLIIFLFYQIGFLFSPIIEFITTLFFPILVAGILYFVLRPLVRFVEEKRVPRSMAIFIVYLLILVAIGLFSAYLGPIIAEQVDTFIALSSAHPLDLVKEKTVNIINLLHLNIYTAADLKSFLTTLLYKLNNFIGDNIVDTVKSVTRFALLLFITPFILYYFLKDDRKIYEWCMRLVSARYQREVITLLRDIDQTLSMFITGQLLVASMIGGMLLIGYLIIGLDYAFTLALFATFFFTIPMLGSFMATIPALLVGLSDSPWMAIKVGIVMSVVLILESNFLSPQVMGQRLHIHPLTLMLILLASGSLYGVLGLFLATPVYALAKVIFANLYAFYHKKRSRLE